MQKKSCKSTKKMKSNPFEFYNLNDRLVKLAESKDNVIGRYSMSKLWAINNGYLKPEDYIKGEPITPEGARRMKLGTKKHELLEELFPEYETEVKKEMKVKDFEIVGIADILDLEGNNVIDFKTSDKLKEAKSWDEYQVKIYCTLFERPEGLILQPVYKGNNHYLKLITKVVRDDSWFSVQMDKLEKFHNKLKKCL